MSPSPDPSHTKPTGDPAAAVPLSSLREGQRGKAHISQLACDDCDLLHAMGLTDDCELRVCRNGEPCIVQVHSTRLGLSAALAKRIMVTVSAPIPLSKSSGTSHPPPESRSASE